MERLSGLEDVLAPWGPFPSGNSVREEFGSTFSWSAA